MAETIKFELIFEGNSISGMNNASEAAAKLAGKLNLVRGSMERATAKFIYFNQFSQFVQQTVASFQELSKAGMQLETSMSELGALTGLAADKLKLIEGYAKDSAKTFGGSASSSVESYKLILSQLGPEIAKVPEALAAMGSSVSVLSKTMGNDVTGAAEVLTAAMNQYRVSLEDPLKASEEMARMMNVMAAAAQAGSAELPAIKAALEQCGMAAASANVSFEEMNAAIQVLDAAGRKASEGGVALRNVLSTLSQGRFLPKDVLAELSAAGISVDMLTDKSLSLSTKLEALRPLLSDTALMTKLFGKENSNAAMALISNTEKLADLSSAITGTKSASEQAGVVMESTSERLSRIAAGADNVKIAIYNATKEIQPWMAIITQTLVPISQMLPLIKSVAMIFGKLHTAMVKANVATRVATAVSTAYNRAIKSLTAALGSARAASAALAGALTLGLGIAIQAVMILVDKLRSKKEKMAQASREAAQAEKSYQESAAEVRGELNLYATKLEQVKGNKEEEKRLVRELNEKYGDAFGTYKSAAEWYDTLISKSGDYCKILINEAKIRDLASKAANAGMEADRLNKEASALPDKTEKMTYNGMGGWISVTGDNPAKQALKDQADVQATIVTEANAQMESLLKENAELLANFGKGLRTKSNDSGGGGGDISEEVQKLINKYHEVPTNLQKIADNNEIFGESQKTAADQADYLKRTIQELVNGGLAVESKYVQQLIKDYKELTIAKPAAEKRNLPKIAGMKVSSSLTPNGAVSQAKVKAPSLNDLEGDSGLDGYNNNLANMTERAQLAMGAIGNLGSAMQSLSGVVGEGAAGWLSYGANVLSAVAQALPAIAQMIGGNIAQAFAGATAQSQTVPFPYNIIALASSLAAVGAAVASIPKFAEGGIAYGATLGIFGEYPGASNNPEVVAPLSKLKDMIEPAGGVYGQVEFVIQGRTLKGILRKVDRIDRRTA